MKRNFFNNVNFASVSFVKDKGDGNCFSRALAVARGWKEEEFWNVKCVLIAYLVVNRTKTGLEAVDRIVSLCKESGANVWCGTEEARNFARASGRSLSIHSALSETDVPVGVSMTIVPPHHLFAVLPALHIMWETSFCRQM
jgi:hypothetical protein